MTCLFCNEEVEQPCDSLGWAVWHCPNIMFEVADEVANEEGAPEEQIGEQQGRKA